MKVVVCEELINHFHQLTFHVTTLDAPLFASPHLSLQPPMLPKVFGRIESLHSVCGWPKAQPNKNASFDVVLVEVSIIVSKLWFFCCFPGHVFFLLGCEASCVIFGDGPFCRNKLQLQYSICFLLALLVLVGALRCDSWI